MGLMRVSGKALLGYAASVSVPALILQGEGDGVVKPEGARLLYERLGTKEKQIIMLPKADHDIFGLLLPSDSPLPEKARKVIEMIQKWLIRASGG
jgi:alpha-beta hydrolase superfamily lysophospholipase